MLQKDLEIHIRQALLKGLAEHGANAIPVIKAFQSPSQGRQDGIYFHLLSESSSGWQGRKYGNVTDMVETQYFNSTYQFGAIRNQDASDWIRIVRMITQSLSFVEYLRKLDIGVQRAGEIVNVQFENENGQYDFNPNFTITFAHKESITPLVPYADRVTTEVFSI